MPVYDYRCRGCGHTFDRLRPLAEADAPGPCPTCAGEDTARLPSRIARRTSVGSSLPMAGGAPSAGPSAGGGCCGGGCCA